MVLTSCSIQLPIVDVNSDLRGKSSLDQLFILVFHYGETGFLWNCVDRTDPLAIRDGINYPIVKSFTISAWTASCIIGFNLRCGSLLGVESSLRRMRGWTMIGLHPFILVIVQPMASLCFLRIALRSSSSLSFNGRQWWQEMSLVRLDRRTWDAQVRLSILRKRKTHRKDELHLLAPYLVK